MAIEITPKIKVKEVFWPSTFLIVCIILIVIFAGSYFFFVLSSKKISEDIESKERAIIKTPSERLLEEEILVYESKINSFKNLLVKHKKATNVFGFLEEISHPNILFKDFDFNSSENTVRLSGEADDFISLGQQLFILKEVDVLKNVNLSEITMSEEGWVNFSLQLTLDPRIYK